ncbi:hypothetical protein [Actinoplanes cyaneus]|uniref:hypothetical protein n=1 Tax=Actinoplanes cyaneus TaxID=52696 RepID=UPI001942E91B|nr:hypothetical protein [Actinoplanes cyaneus]MCW2142759.1 hypothetical protein [Actinoplanes cyaneus]
MPDLRSFSARSPGTPGRRWLIEGACIVLVAVIAALLFLVRYQDPARAASGDSFWYMRQALIFTGVDAETARVRVEHIMCQDINRSLADKHQKPTCKSYDTTKITQRYRAIFDSRPGYPLFGAPFVAVLGPWTGMMAATLVLAMVAGVLAYLAVWMASGLRLAGILASAALFVLPTGFWMSRMLVESGMVAGFLAVLIGAMLIQRGRRSGIALISVALIWLFAARSASGLAMSLVLLGAGALSLVHRESRRSGAIIAGLGAAGAVGWQLLSKVLGLPGFNETVQDFATRHFKDPDIPDPVPWLIEQNLKFWPTVPLTDLMDLVKPAALLLVVAVFVVRLRPVAALWIFTGLIGVAMIVAHPVHTEWERLTLPLWIPVAAVLGFGTALALTRPARTPDPAGPPSPEEAPGPPVTAPAQVG